VFEMIEPTPSMQAGAAVLLDDPTRWTHARRRADGREFWIVRGRTSTYYVRHDGCTCPGFARRGICSHSLAATYREARQASQEAPCELPATFAIGGRR
jgi:predicted nucleic acid-binding Zn finger protein